MAKKIAMRAEPLLAIMLLLCFVCGSMAADTLSSKCAAEFQKVTACLGFATGKAPSPSKECCGAVTDLKKSDPACLCYVIQQVHNGSNAEVKSMGVQEFRLLQLPSACKLANASVSECPKLLHLAPNSPDAAIFTNTSTSATPTSTPGTSSPTTASGSNAGFLLQPCLAGSIAVASLIYFSMFPAGSGFIGFIA